MVCCLCALHDRAFDTGLLTVDEQYSIVISDQISDYLPNVSIEFNLVRHHGREIFPPEKFMPNQEFLRYHNDNIFLSN